MGSWRSRSAECCDDEKARVRGGGLNVRRDTYRLERTMPIGDEENLEVLNVSC